MSVALPLAESVGRFKTDSEPDGAAGIGGFCELAPPDELSGANVLGGVAVLGAEVAGLVVVEGVVVIDGACIVVEVGTPTEVEGTIIVETAGATSVAPVHGSMGTFMTMVRGVR